MKKIPKIMAAALFVGLFIGNTAVYAGESGVAIVPPNAKFHGKTYPEWAAAFWQYAFPLPVEGHPFLAGPNDDFSAGQSGSVWFWSAPDGPMTRTVRMPAGKALFFDDSRRRHIKPGGSSIFWRHRTGTTGQLRLVC
jgi:hypothetical protein